MKTNALLLLASLAVLTSTASAASSSSDATVLVLPTYVVTAPRVQPPEQQIKARLDEFRQQALTPIAIVPNLNLPNSRVDLVDKRAVATRVPTGTSAAKS